MPAFMGDILLFYQGGLKSPVAILKYFQLCSLQATCVPYYNTIDTRLSGIILYISESNEDQNVQHQSRTLFMLNDGRKQVSGREL